MSIKMFAISASVPFIKNIPLIGFYQGEEPVMAPSKLHNIYIVWVLSSCIARCRRWSNPHRLVRKTFFQMNPVCEIISIDCLKRTNCHTVTLFFADCDSISF